MHFTIITEGLPFSGDTLKHSSLGGSETAVLEVARNIAKQGHEVDVFCNCDNEGKFEGVRYNHITKYVDFIKGGHTDVCIVSRFSQYLTFGKIPSKVNVLWCHDIIDDNSKDMMMSAMWAVDYMYCLTDFHKWQFTNVLPDLEPIIKLTSNGIDRSLIKKEKKLHRIMFTSRPERGLMKALDLYEQLGDKSLEMLVCNYKTLDVEQVRQIEGMARRRIDDLIAKGFNVTEGRFTKDKLYKEISKSKAVIYPTAFPEIFCISAVEAQANGTVYITTDDYALTETVGYKGVELDENYDKNFLAIMKGIIYDDEARKEFEKIGKEHVKKYTWENVAKQFIDDASKFMANRFENNKEACYRRMIHDSNYVLLREYLEKHEPDHKLLEQLNHNLRFVDGKDDYKEIYENEETHANKVCIYGRVSSHEQKQKGDLDRQCQRISEHCAKNKYQVDFILKDVGSGLSDSRKGLIKLFNLVIEKQIFKVVIEHRDRLTRFQYNFFEFFFNSYGVEIEVVEKKESEENDELVEDIMMLMASFSGKLYGRRSAKRRKKQIK